MYKIQIKIKDEITSSDSKMDRKSLCDKIDQVYLGEKKLYKNNTRKDILEYYGINPSFDSDTFMYCNFDLEEETWFLDNCICWLYLKNENNQGEFEITDLLKKETKRESVNPYEVIFECSKNGVTKKCNFCIDLCMNDRKLSEHYGEIYTSHLYRYADMIMFFASKGFVHKGATPGFQSSASSLAEAMEVVNEAFEKFEWLEDSIDVLTYTAYGEIMSFNKGSFQAFFKK